MKVAIAYGKFYSNTMQDFAYLQKTCGAGNEVIIIIGKSDRQNVIADHISLLKFSNYVTRIADEKYGEAIAKLASFREASPDDNIELVLVRNPDESDAGLQEICEKNGVSYLI